MVDEVVLPKLLVARTTGAVVEEVVLPKLLVARTTGAVVEEVVLPKLLVASTTGAVVQDSGFRNSLFSPLATLVNTNVYTNKH